MVNKYSLPIENVLINFPCEAKSILVDFRFLTLKYRDANTIVSE